MNPPGGQGSCPPTLRKKREGWGTLRCGDGLGFKSAGWATRLAELNTQLRGRSGGHFATCIAASLDPNGTLQFANAGHLPPYLNGSEIAVEGSLPLGIAEHLDSATQRLQLSPGDTLTFITDGVVEAANSAGELFGFERTCEISTHSAAQIAAAAQAFGQEDDITVLTVEGRLGNL